MIATFLTRTRNPGRIDITDMAGVELGRSRHIGRRDPDRLGGDFVPQDRRRDQRFPSLARSAGDGEDRGCRQGRALSVWLGRCRMAAGRRVALVRRIGFSATVIDPVRAGRELQGSGSDIRQVKERALPVVELQRPAREVRFPDLSLEHGVRHGRRHGPDADPQFHGGLRAVEVPFSRAQRDVRADPCYPDDPAVGGDGARLHRNRRAESCPTISGG